MPLRLSRKSTGRTIAAGAFLFFFVKGMAWLVLGGLAMWGLTS